jgi:hypothetical protein
MNAEPVVKMVRTSAFATCVCVSVCVGTIAVLAEAQQSEMPRAVSALNWLDQSGEYFHSPVLAALFREQRVRLHAPEYIREFGGLLVPAGFDCDMFNDEQRDFEHPFFDRVSLYPYARWAGSFPSYFMGVPSRWIWCWEQYAAMESGLRFFPESLPCIDEEYVEYVSWAQSAMRARGQFVGIELGARWGTWGARAVTFLRMLNSTIPYSLLYVEPKSEHCAGLEQVHKLNGVNNFTLVCEYAKAEDIMTFMSQHSRIDVFDMDIEGDEFELLLASPPRSTQLRQMLRDRVVRLIVGTHTTYKHEQIREVLLDEGWELLSEVPFTSNASCLNHYLRPVGRRKSPEQMMHNGCYFEHPVFGPMAQYDGGLIFDNPAFVSAHPNVGFRFESPHLLVNDLLLAGEAGGAGDDCGEDTETSNSCPRTREPSREDDARRTDEEV